MEKKKANNDKMNLALDFIINTEKNLLILGKAGTGKTTFLRKLKECCTKQMVVVAPTGIAAINAGGTTIHSFFRLPYSPFIPGKINYSRGINLDDGHNQVYNTLELLVIDEISMVRADLLDAIDHELRIKRNSNVIFGGVQLLLIGDLFQLPPVIASNDKKLFDKYYTTPFFFGSHSFSKADFHIVELKKVYRQENKKFINLLNKVREARISLHDLKILNSRYFPDYSCPKDRKCIKLVTHNAQAAKDNAFEYERLETEEKEYAATIEGDFPESNFPVDYILKLKVGSRVMFTKNDISNGYCNGTLGEVISLQDDSVTVLTDDSKTIITKRTSWENVDYDIYTNEDEEDDIVEKQIGRFIQFPLRFAWSITVHKSQGLTFDSVIIDIHKAFAPGQAYVALSRCRSLEGIVMTRKVNLGVLKHDKVVDDFYCEIKKKEITNNILIRSTEMDKVQITSKDIFPVDKNIEGHFSIPEGVTEIPKEAFSGCNKLASVKIPKSVIKIGEGAFSKCENLTEVEIQNPEITVGRCLFYGCKKIQKPIIVGKKFVYLPSTFSGVFDVPDGIEIIVDGAFIGCENLTGINMPNSVTYIGENAFTDCRNLTNVMIPNSVKSIEAGTFCSCYKLANIELPNSITTIGEMAFYECGLKNIEIPNSVKSIGEAAFWYCDYLQTIFIPSSVTNIGKESFMYCYSLDQVELPAQLTHIPDSAFEDCRNLSKIEIPNSVKSIGNKAFRGCRNLNKIKIPDSVTTIGDCAFLGSAIPRKTHIIDRTIVCVASDVTDVFVIPEGVERIAGGAFFECRNLVGVEIPDSVNYIGESAFYGCSNLASIIIPNSVNNIKSHTFKNCTRLSKIQLPKYMTVIEAFAFEGCTNLTDLTMPQNLDKIGSYAFSRCSSLTSIIIPSMLKEIDSGSFSGCNKLSFIEIPPSVEKIGSWAFEGCSSLANFEIPNSISCIERGSFKYCYCIQKIEIPESVKKIGEDAFKYCNGITSVFIPKSITVIEEGAFAGCNNLNSIEVDNNNENYKSIDDVLFSSDGTLLSYPCASNKKVYKIPEGTKVVASGAFSYASCLEQIKFNNELELLNDSIFKGCRSLKEIVIPERIKEIPKETFFYCNNLCKVYLHNAIISIGESAFCGCKSLSEIHICVSNPEQINCTFSVQDVSNITLFVPVGTGYAYRHHSEFSKFKEVVIERCL